MPRRIGTFRIDDLAKRCRDVIEIILVDFDGRTRRLKRE